MLLLMIVLSLQQLIYTVNTQILSNEGNAEMGKLKQFGGREANTSRSIEKVMYVDIAKSMGYIQNSDVTVVITSTTNKAGVYLRSR